MRIRRRGNAGDVIDQRGQRSGGLGGLPIGAAGGGGIGLIVLILVALLGKGALSGDGGFDFGDTLNRLPNAQEPQQVPAGQATPDPQGDLKQFMTDVLDDIQTTWDAQFTGTGRTYQKTKLVLFTDGVQTACGNATSAVGPFYCPGDSLVYIDLDFFQQLEDQFGAPGDFAQAYVLAHEVGHHIQNLIGVDDEVRKQSADNPDDQNELSVRQELQADCFAGVWGSSANRRGILEGGDLEEGLAAAQSVGDDRIQKQAGVDVNPETWTHGSSESRMKWFRRGFDTGNPTNCDTFSGDIE